MKRPLFCDYLLCDLFFYDFNILTFHLELANICPLCSLAGDVPVYGGGGPEGGGPLTAPPLVTRLEAPGGRPAPRGCMGGATRPLTDSSCRIRASTTRPVVTRPPGGAGPWRTQRQQQQKEEAVAASTMLEQLVYVANATVVYAAAAVPLLHKLDTTADTVQYAQTPYSHVTVDVVGADVGGGGVVSGSGMGGGSGSSQVTQPPQPPQLPAPGSSVVSVASHHIAGNVSSLTLSHNWTEAFNRRKDPELRALDDLVHTLNLYYIPVVVAFGLLANFVAFVVFRVSDIRRLPVTPYLSCLAVSDIGFMFSFLFIWMKSTHAHDAICTPGICQMMWYMNFLTNFLSIWYLVCLQVDRYITMWHPTRANAHDDTKRARCVCTVLTLVAMVIYSMCLWTVGIQRTKGINAKKQCSFMPKYSHIIRVFSKIDTFISAVMPYTMLPVLNALILTQIVIRCMALKRHAQNNHAGDGHANNLARRLRSQIKLTASLLCITLIIWSLSVTSQWMRIQDFFKEDPERTMTRRQKLKHDIYQYPHYAAVAVKLILYVIFSGTFREGAAECCGGCTCDCSACKEEEEDNIYDECEENAVPPPIVEHVSQV